MRAQPAILALAAAAVMLVGGRAGTSGGGLLGALVALPFRLAGAVGAALARGLGRLAAAVARRLGVRPRHTPALLATGLLVVQAAPRAGWRLPLALAAVGWLVWLRRPDRVTRLLRRAERAHTAALHQAAAALRRRTRTKAEPTLPTAPLPAPRPAKPAPHRDATTTRAARNTRPPKPTAPAPYWLPPPPGLEPVWPRWLGGGRRRRRKDRA